MWTSHGPATVTAIATIDEKTDIEYRMTGEGIEFVFGGPAGLSLLIEEECTERYLDLVTAAVALWKATDHPET